ncbi:MAG: pyridoxamine 5'-phosphate oxidase family protein [Vicinamibacteria bacterium]|jgi:hypothetical protein|nr:pyridoxamine 5'-phosphate oxidase family protein [Vicinamibacteria bacterium]
MHDPFHAGERAIQEQTGERDVALMNGQLIADRVPPAARPFVTQQQYCALGWASAEGDPWAVFVGGPRGFARTDQDGATLHLRLEDELDTLSRIPPFHGMREGDPVGALFIELATRRRLRVNGRCAARGNRELSIAVEQAHPLCPKYIQRRQLERRESGSATLHDVREGDALPADLIAWIAAADTFFVASAQRAGAPADVSHRGGRPGFVELEDGTLRIPDYPGNSLFNTLGNFAQHPRAGLAFLDFATNRQLQLTGDVRLDLAAGTGETGGTGRWWEFRPRRFVVSPLNQPFAWTLVDASPFNP